MKGFVIVAFLVVAVAAMVTAMPNSGMIYALSHIYMYIYIDFNMYSNNLMNFTDH